MSAGIDIGASGALTRARALMRHGALDAADTIVNDALARAPRDADALQRYADRSCAKHTLGITPPAPSHFFGARLDGPDQVRAFFDMLRSLSAGA